MRHRPIIGVLIPLVGGYYYANILAGIVRVAEQRGARVVAFQTTGLNLYWPDEPNTAPLGWDRIDGFIGVHTHRGIDHYRRILAAGKPLVTVSGRLDLSGTSAVLPDNHNGVAAAVKHLLAHGHRRIGFVGALTQEDLRERYQAYQSALREHGIEPDPALYFALNGAHELEARAVGARIVAAGLPCTAVLACTDLNAMGVMHSALEAGYRVPEDLAVIGFDDIEAAQYADPPLATVRQRFDAVSAAAAETLLRHLLDKEPLPALVRVPTEFVPRQSCGCGLEAALVEPPADPGQGDRVARLADALCAFALRQATQSRNATRISWPGARELAEHVDAVVQGGSGLEARALREAWFGFLQIAHDVESVEGVVSLLEDAAQLWSAPTRDNERALALKSRMRHMRRELFRSWRVAEQTRRRYYDSVVEANRNINLRLIGADVDTAQDLSWLAWTRASFGCIGLWTRSPERRNRELEIVSEFGTAPDKSLRGARHMPAQFPSSAIAELLESSSPDQILTIIPLTAKHENRGLLAVIGPVEVEMIDNMGTLGHWAALLSAALDRQELLTSLREGFDREFEIARTLRDSEERYALAALGANDGLWDWNLVTGQLYCSPRWKAMLGCADDEVAPNVDAWLGRIHKDDLSTVKAAFESHFSRQRPFIEHEYRILHEDGTYRWVLCRGVAVFDENGRPVRAAGSQTEITARKETEAQLRRSALHDALTGLPNRTLLLDRLEQAIGRSRRNASCRFAVLFLDLDRFKTINDGLGHLVGDRLLIEIAGRLRASLRDTDTVARLGGDEFAIILADLESEQDAMMISDRIQHALRAPFELSGHRVFTSTSIGITFSSERYQRAEDFLRDADTAMYRAKNHGRARHELFNERMHDQAMERLSLETGLRSALENGQFVLHYQPIVSVQTGQITGVEALIRWLHPEKGLLSPAVFLPVAEETGLIVPISQWVLRTACVQSKAWQNELGRQVRISVNLPSQQLKDTTFTKLVVRTLSETGVDPTSLGVELVESSLIENVETTIGILRALHEMGVYISVDDFGTGYSSLSYLKRFPISALKIDRSFTQGIPLDANDMAISNAIIAMSKNLHLSVVAEGVETREQLDYLRTHGCDMLQGYYFSRPLPADKCLTLLQGNHEPDLVREVRPSKRPPRFEAAAEPRDHG